MILKFTKRKVLGKLFSTYFQQNAKCSKRVSTRENSAQSIVFSCSAFSYLVCWQTRSGNPLLPRPYKHRQLCIAPYDISSSLTWQNRRRAHHNTIRCILPCFSQEPPEVAYLHSSHHEALHCRRTSPGRRIALWPTSYAWVGGKLADMEGTCHSLLFFLSEVVRWVLGWSDSPIFAFLWGTQGRL